MISLTPNPLSMATRRFILRTGRATVHRLIYLLRLDTSIRAPSAFMTSTFGSLCKP